ncbi:MAG: AsmA family protein [Melioribacteraceae bacterium]|nr:AsmA family protein [Melioribacteraceae bacterium]
MKRFLKILGYFFLTIFVLVLLALLFTQTGWFSSIVKEKVEGIANENLNGNLSIGEIDGSFFSSIEIIDLRIEQNNETVFYTKKIDVNYNLFGLLSSTIDINTAIIDSFYVHLIQINDSTWNINSLIKQTEEDTTSAGVGWDIVINSFEINNSRIEY